MSRNSDAALGAAANVAAAAGAVATIALVRYLCSPACYVCRRFFTRRKTDPCLVTGLPVCHRCAVEIPEERIGPAREYQVQRAGWCTRNQLAALWAERQLRRVAFEDELRRRKQFAEEAAEKVASAQAARARAARAREMVSKNLVRCCRVDTELAPERPHRAPPPRNAQIQSEWRTTKKAALRHLKFNAALQGATMVRNLREHSRLLDGRIVWAYSGFI